MLKTRKFVNGWTIIALKSPIGDRDWYVFVAKGIYRRWCQDVTNWSAPSRGFESSQAALSMATAFVNSFVYLERI